MKIKAFIEIFKTNRTELETLAAQALKPLTYRERQRIHEKYGHFKV